MGIRQSLRTAALVARTAQDAPAGRRHHPSPRCPPGYHTGPPHFVGVGIQKGGTTWWTRALFAHPDIAKSTRKELRFFQHHWDEEFTAARVAQYHRYFPRQADQRSGEWTPRYMFDPWTTARLHQAAPDARILVFSATRWLASVPDSATSLSTTPATSTPGWWSRP